MSRVYISKSKIGKGLFANKEFNPGEIIIEFKGDIISLDEDLDVPEKVRSNSIRYDEEKYLSQNGDFGEYINHSCNPNTAIKKARGKLYLFSLKKIEPKSELFFDYSTNLAEDDIWTMKCKCSEKNCRKMIKNFPSLPKKLREKYVEIGAVPKFILKVSD